MEIAERNGGVFGVDGGAVEEISRDDGEVGVFAIENADDSGGKTAVADVTEVKVADESEGAVVPVGREILEANGDPFHAGYRGVDQAVETDDKRRTE